MTGEGVDARELVTNPFCHHGGGAGRDQYFWRSWFGSRHVAERGGDCGVEQRAGARPPTARSGRHADGGSLVANGALASFCFAQPIMRQPRALRRSEPASTAQAGAHVVNPPVPQTIP